MTATNIAHRECIIEHCTQNQNRINATTGYCLNHDRRWKRYGDPMQFYRSSGDTAAERFWSLTKPDGDCIIWQGSKNRKGYGRKKYDGTQRLVHHIARDIKRLLLRLYKKYRSGEITETQAQRETVMLFNVLKAIEITETEERLQAVESILKRD